MQVDRVSIPFSLAAKAYAAGGATPVRPAEPVRASERSTSLKGPARLVGGAVPGRVSFVEPDGAPAPESGFAMYRHPADRNAAATGVHAGRVLDVTA